MRLSIVVPCYNEEKNIPLIFEKFDKAIGNLTDVEVVLVDNGSLDNSALIIKKHIAKYPFAKTIKVEVNKGYGFGVLSGLRSSSGDYIGWTHADMQTDPSDVIKAWNIIKKRSYPSCIYVKGNRRNRSFYNNLFTIGMSILESCYFQCKLWDINAQPNVFHKSFFKLWSNPPSDFSLDLYSLYMARKHNLNVIRFPVLFPQRMHGQSSWDTGIVSKIKLILRTIIFSRQLKKEVKK